MTNKWWIGMWLIFISFSLSARKPAELEVLTFNVRYDNPGDGVNQWKYRRDYAAELIRFYQPDIFGAQEVLDRQLTDLQTRLPEYASFGAGREDGKKEGEYTPVFYRKDRLKLLESGNFWLAERPDSVGMKGWDGACKRVATWGIFADRKSGKKFLFLNTHLDHIGKTARREGARLLRKQAEKLAADLPVVLTGDFNAAAGEEPIRILTDPSDPRAFTDSRSIAAVQYGPEGSWHDFGKIPLERMNLIDYIFIKGNFRVVRHGVLSESKGALYPSDHYPVLATLLLE